MASVDEVFVPVGTVVPCVTELDPFVFIPDTSRTRGENIETCHDCLIEFVEAVSPGGGVSSLF
jgi:hypothetical protein